MDGHGSDAAPHHRGDSREGGRDKAYKNAQRNNDKQNARIEHDKALARVMNSVLKDDTELFKQFSDNESFRRWLSDAIFGTTYEPLRNSGSKTASRA